MERGEEVSRYQDQTPKRPKQRKAISSVLSKRLFQEAESRCPFCDVGDIAALQIHHIDEDPSNDQAANLIVVCANCHSKITCGEITSARVHARKLELLQARTASRRYPEEPPVHSVSVSAVNVSDSIIANNVTVRGKRSPRVQHPPDAIGSDTIKKGYIDYLIKRYYDYRLADLSYGRAGQFSHAVIHTNIQRKFKARTFFIHVSRFEELCDYLKERVDQTIQGKRNRSQGQSNYGSFEDYEAEQLHRAL